MRTHPGPPGRLHWTACAMVTMVLSFPTDDELLIAIRGQHVGEHRLCQLGRELGALHEQWIQTPLDLEGPTVEACPQRVELIDEIDVWVAQRLPVPHPQASVHTETIGTVIDRLARSEVHACHLLMTLDPRDPQVHAAWTHLAELADGYTDLTAAVVNRSRRLPVRGHRW